MTKFDDGVEREGCMAMVSRRYCGLENWRSLKSGGNNFTFDTGESSMTSGGVMYSSRQLPCLETPRGSFFAALSSPRPPAFCLGLASSWTFAPRICLEMFNVMIPGKLV